MKTLNPLATLLLNLLLLADQSSAASLGALGTTPVSRVQVPALPPVAAGLSPQAQALAAVQAVTLKALALPAPAPALAAAGPALTAAPAAPAAAFAGPQAELGALAQAQGQAAAMFDGSAERRGERELAAAVELSRATPERLEQAARALDDMSDEQVARLSAAAESFLKTETPRSTPGAVAANWEHVASQHLAPLEDDAEQLARLFARKPGQSAEQFKARLRLLMLVHDLGKVEIPADMKAALARAFPNKDGMWYVNMFILPHEYASMHWIAALGRQSGLDGARIEALQLLIANHNFGPDLADPANADLSSHWWPANFQRGLVPALAAMGIRVERYGSAAGNRYSALLAAYDRALANEHTGYGLAAWAKFAKQDYQAWASSGKGMDQTPFSGPALVARMKTSAQWTRREIDAMWRALYEREVKPGLTWEQFQQYAPFKKQREGIDRLLALIQSVEEANKMHATPGVTYYLSADLKTQYRVRMKSDRTAVVEHEQRAGDWQIVDTGADPIDLYFRLIKKDRQGL